MREEFLKSLESLNNEMLEMLKDCKNGIDCMYNMLKDKDDKKIIKIFKKLDLDSIKEQANLLLLKQQPLAKDFFFLTSVLNVLNDMQNIKEHSINAIKTLEEIPPRFYDKNLLELLEIAKASLNIIIKLFKSKDLKYYKSLLAYEKKMNAKFNEIKKLVVLKLKKDSKHINEWLNFLIFSKYIERICDNMIEASSHIKEGIENNI